MRRLLLAAFLAFGPAVFAAPPATAPAVKPKDDTTDWLLNQGAPSAAPRPDERPDPAAGAPAPGPAAPGPAAPGPDATDARDPKAQQHQRFGSRKGTLFFSDGEKIHGWLSTTLDKPVRVWEEAKSQYRDVPFSLVKSFEAKVLWERDEPEWHFKESGSDVKEFSGKTYPARETRYTVTLSNGQSVAGGVSSPIYLETSGGDKVFVFHKRDKGEPGQTLKQLVYLKSVEFEH